MLGAEDRNVASLFLHFTSLCPDTSTSLIFLSLRCQAQVPTHPKLPLCRRCLFSMRCYTAPFHTPQGNYPNLALPFCSLDCYYQPCSLSVVLVSQGHAILVLLNKQINLLQALFITPSSVLCLRPQSLPATALDTCKSKDFPVLYWRHNNSRGNSGDKTSSKSALSSHLAPHTHSHSLSPICLTSGKFLHYSAFSSQQNPRLHPSSWQGSKTYSSPVGMRAPCLKLQLKIKTASSVFTTTGQVSSWLEHESCS